MSETTVGVLNSFFYKYGKTLNFVDQDQDVLYCLAHTLPDRVRDVSEYQEPCYAPVAAIYITPTKITAVQLIDVLHKPGDATKPLCTTCHSTWTVKLFDYHELQKLLLHLCLNNSDVVSGVKDLHILTSANKFHSGDGCVG